jgi:hypothetical protein
MTNPIHVWRALLVDSYTTWVLFRHGTCVLLDQPADDPAAWAAEHLARYGRVQPGTDTADFNVVPAPGGRLVTCYRPEILVYIGDDEVPPDQDDLLAGLLGRKRRHDDAAAPRTTHAEIARARPPHCACLDVPGKQLSPRRELGMDSHYAEASVWACRVCGRRWLRYFYENEAITGSGRWYLGHITPARALGITANEARQALSGLEWYHAGGSYFDGRAGRGSGDILL